MRFVSLLIAALITALPAAAQETAPVTRASETPSEPAALNLPISFQKIREGLLQPQPTEGKTNMDAHPDQRNGLATPGR